MFTFNVRKLFRNTFGSWETATPQRRKPRATFKPRLEALEERWLPSGTGPDAGGGGGGGGNDSYVWKPTDGNNAGNYKNWWDSTTGKQATQLPGPTNPTALDGSVSNSPIVGGLTVASLTVQNNYNNTMTLAGSYQTTAAGVTIQKGCTLTIALSTGAGGITLPDGFSFVVQNGATVNLSDSPQPYGGGTFVQCLDVNKGGIFNDAGVVNWNGTAVSSGNTSIIDNIGLPVLVSGSARFNADGGTKGISTSVGGTLMIKGQDANTANVGFEMTGDAMVNLMNGATLSVPFNYLQTSGQLTSDNSVCTLSTGVGGNGDINIAGGEVVVDDVANTVNVLKFMASTVELNGTLLTNGLTLGGKSTQSDFLDCGKATVTLGSNSYLTVGTTGTGALGTGNQWTVMGYGSIKGSWGIPPRVPTGMTASTGATQVLVTN